METVPKTIKRNGLDSFPARVRVPPNWVETKDTLLMRHVGRK